MQNIVDLTQTLEEETLSSQSLLYEKWTKKFYEFLLARVSSDAVKERMKYVYDNLSLFLVEEGTIIPRTRDGRDFSVPMPNRGGVYIVEDITTTLDENKRLNAAIKPAVAIKPKGHSIATFIHELSHAFSSTMKYSDADGAFYKCGLDNKEMKNGEFENRSGDFLNEGMTDAIAKIFYDMHIEEIKQDFPKKQKIGKPKYNFPVGYDSIWPLMDMLGEGLSNKLLMDAYFGGKEELLAFENHFDELMKDEGITFKELNSLYYETYTYEGEDSDLSKLKRYALIYKQKYYQLQIAQEDVVKL